MQGTALLLLTITITISMLLNKNLEYLFDVHNSATYEKKKINHMNDKFKKTDNKIQNK